MMFEFEVVKVSSMSAEKIDYSTLIFKIPLPKKLDMENSKDLWIFLKTLISGGAQKIYINMKNVEFIDSSGIGIIINAAKLVRKQKGDIILSDVSENIKSIFKLIHFENFIKVYNNEIEALNSLRYV